MPPTHLNHADLHLHTLASDGLMSARQVLDAAEADPSLTLIAITDHDEISASLEGREIAVREGYRIRVVTGVEVTTRDGHLLALFVEERPAALRPARETAEWVRNHGGICIAAHPYTHLTHALRGATLTNLATDGLIVGVETLNASPAGRDSHGPALRLSSERN